MTGLVTQVEVVMVYLQDAEQHIASQEKNATELDRKQKGNATKWKK